MNQVKRTIPYEQKEDAPFDQWKRFLFYKGWKIKIKLDVRFRQRERAQQDGVWSLNKRGSSMVPVGAFLLDQLNPTRRIYYCLL